MRIITYYLTLGLINIELLIGSPVVAEEIKNGAEKARSNLRLIETAAGLSRTPLTIEEVVANIIQIALGFVGLVFIVLMIYGGYLWMLARGNDEKVTKARDLIVESTIGIVIVFLSYFITAFVVQRAGEALFEPFFRF